MQGGRVAKGVRADGLSGERRQSGGRHRYVAFEDRPYAEAGEDDRAVLVPELVQMTAVGLLAATLQMVVHIALSPRCSPPPPWIETAAVVTTWGCCAVRRAAPRERHRARSGYDDADRAVAEIVKLPWPSPCAAHVLQVNPAAGARCSWCSAS